MLSLSSSSGERSQPFLFSTSSSLSGAGTVAATEFVCTTGEVRWAFPASCQSSIPLLSYRARLSRVHLEEVKLAWGTRGDQKIQDFQNDQKVHWSVGGPAVLEFHAIIPLGPLGQGGRGKQRCEHPTSAGHKGSAIQDGWADAVDAGLPKDFTTTLDIWNTAQLLPWCNIQCQ